MLRVVLSGAGAATSADASEAQHGMAISVPVSATLLVQKHAYRLFT
jgi:hypothetical protein